MEILIDCVYTIPGALVCLIITIIMYMFTKRKSDSKLPPGPYPLPLLGTIYKHGVYVHSDTFMALAEDYGPVYSVFLGPTHYVILNSYDAIRNAMNRPFEFCHRGVSNKYTWRLTRTDQVHGIFSKDYDADSVRVRNECIGIMRKLGMGKPIMENYILEEMEALCVALKDKQTEPIKLNDIINTSIANIMMRILLNKRYAHGDPEIIALIKQVDDLIKNVFNTTFIDSLPVIRFLPPFKEILAEFVSGQRGVIKFMNQKAQSILDTFDPSAPTDSLVESYFESHYNEETQQVEVDMSVFKYIISDLVTGGFDTSATGILWTILLLANRQDIQEKLYNEISTNTKTDEPVRHSDKDSLPYLEAVIWEVHRFRPGIPFIFHQTGDKDATLGDYTIPRKTMVINNHVAVHMDENTWGDPLVFRPARFIDDEGKFVRHPQLIPFSTGKRSCPGELLAKQELYLFTGNLIKRFRFYPPDGVNNIDEEPIRDSIYFPKPFQVNVVQR